MEQMKQPQENAHASLIIEDNVAELTLNRPDVMNSISVQMLGDIEEAFETCRKEQARVIVIRGAGGNFCAGADLAHVSSLIKNAPDRFSEEFIPRVQEVMNMIEDCPIPVVAAVEGHCIAGGLEFLLCCDVVVAAKSARFSDGHSIFGFLPGSGGTYRLSRKIGSNNAKFLSFTGDSVSAQTMRDFGLVSVLCEDADLADTVRALGGKLALRSPLGLSRMKALLNMATDAPREACLAAEQLASAAHTASHDMSEGLDAFTSKRKPVFTGK